MIIKVQNLSVGYGKKIVLKDLNITFERGTLTGIVGPNGSGKSTFLKTLAALLEPQQGVIYLDFRELHRIPRKELAKIMSVVLTERPDIDLIKVKEFVALGRHPYTGLLGRLSAKDWEVVMESLRLVKAEHLAEIYLTELSDGERQKVLIARALAQEPKILILDEPTTFLDIRHRMEIMSILREIAKKKEVTIIASLHELDLAAKFCDNIIIIKDGRIVAAGPPEEVLNNETLGQVYLLDNVGVWSEGPMFEIKVRENYDIFIVAGAGSGVKVFRAFAREGVGFCTGVLYSFDIDAIVAKTMGAHVVEVEDNVEESLIEAEKLISKSRIVIDAGFPRTPHYVHNVRLVKYAENIGKKIISLRECTIRELLTLVKKFVM